MKIQFKAYEYTSQDTFIESNYQFEGSKEFGWNILRNNEEYLHLGKGYELLKTKYCGICSTDIARRFLPFPLPQIIGHELVAEKEDTKELYAIEINDTSLARGNIDLEDKFIQEKISIHSPTRLVLGIDRLPGGFGPYILAPQNAMVSIEDLDPLTAVLLEPFAAALKAVTTSEPENNQRVAVLGPRRLGSLIIAALKAYRNSTNKKFQIIAIARHDHLLELSNVLGADKTIDLRNVSISSIEKQFDIVYDTTGSSLGFELALKLANKEIHLKSTNGQIMAGVHNLTELVVDELSILPYSISSLRFYWKENFRENSSVYIGEGVGDLQVPSDILAYKTNVLEAYKILNSTKFQSRLPRFDVAIASNILEIEQIIRPFKNSENSLIRPQGAILFKGNSNGNPLLEFINNGGRLRSSRCGDFHYALKILKENLEIVQKLKKNFSNIIYESPNIPEAFFKAKEPHSVKIIIKH